MRYIAAITVVFLATYLVRFYAERTDAEITVKDASVGGPMVSEVLQKVAKRMRTYRATPWYKLSANGEDSWGMLDYRAFPLEPARTKDKYGVDSLGSIEYANPHAGDLLEHSKWTSLQTAVWAQQQAGGETEQSFWMEGVDTRLAVIGGFLHDIAKASDCAFSCMIPDPKHADDRLSPAIPHPSPDQVPGLMTMAPPQSSDSSSEGLHCYQDTYSQLKYQGNHDSNHPEFCAGFLQSAIFDRLHGTEQERFFFECPSEGEMETMWKTDGVNTGIRMSAEFGGAMEKASATVVSNLVHWRDSKDADSISVTASELADALLIPSSDIFPLTVALRMHWDLGRLDMVNWLKMTPAQYVLKFVGVVNGNGNGLWDACGNGKYQNRMSKEMAKDEVRGILKLAIAIAAADISGGSPSRTGPREEKQLVRDPDNAALQICKQVTEAPEEIENLFGPQTAKIMSWIRNICDAGCGVTQEYPEGREACPEKYEGACHAKLGNWGACYDGTRIVCLPNQWGKNQRGVEEKCKATEEQNEMRICAFKNEIRVQEPYCALSQKYPGKDIFTAFGFDKKGRGLRDEILAEFEQQVDTPQKFKTFCKTQLGASSHTDPMLPEIDYMYQCNSFLSERMMKEEKVDCSDDAVETVFLKPVELYKEGATVSVFCDTDAVGYVEVRGVDQEITRIGCSFAWDIIIRKDLIDEHVPHLQASLDVGAKQMAYVHAHSGSAFLKGGYISYNGHKDPNARILKAFEIVDKAGVDTMTLRYAPPVPISDNAWNGARSSLVDYGMKVTEQRYSEVYSRYAWEGGRGHRFAMERKNKRK